MTMYPQISTLPWSPSVKSQRKTVPLVVITGRSLRNQESNREDGEDKSYLLMNELQDILIEDLYPPISSSTVPKNPGRLMIECAIDGGNNNEN